MEILFEDNHLFVVNKPSGMLTQPSGTERENLESQAKLMIKKRDGKPGNVFLEAVYRLDKPVGGIVVFAKTRKALSRLNQAQREKKGQKKYLALVKGPPLKSGTLEHNLLHKQHRAVVHPEGKKSRLHFRVLKTDKQIQLVEIELETGRYHQIRAQLAAAGCPILGDFKYGSDEFCEEGIALVHELIILEHPISREMVTFQISETQYPRIFHQFL